MKSDNKTSFRGSTVRSMALLVVVAGLASQGCSRCARQSPTPVPVPPTSAEDLRDFRAFATAVQERRRNRQANFAGESVQDLIEELRDDSERGIEPFNSTALTMLLEKKGETKDELKAAVDYQAFFLGLLALRRLDADLYREVPAKTRVMVLVEALRTSKRFNAWGLPHRYWSEAGEALIAEGPPAQRELRKLFSDTRPARLWGSRESFESEKYRYRVCDYAWALSRAISDPGKKQDIHENPRVRDTLIAAASRT